MLRDERTALLAHYASCTVIFQALANGKHDVETIIAWWRRKPILQIAEALSTLQLGKVYDHDILKRFTEQELNNLMSAGPVAFASQRNGGDAVCGDGSSSVPSVSAGVERISFMPEQDFESRAWKYSSLSSSGETKAFGGAEPGCGLALGSALTMPHATDDTTPSSQFYRRDSYSPIFETNERSHFDPPAYLAQGEPGAKASGYGSQRISHLTDIGVERNNEARWKVMPFEATHELLEIFFRGHYTPFPTIVKDLFWDDFMAGKRDYCSIALIASMCCLACRIKDGYDIGPSVSLRNQLWHEASSLIRTVNSDDSIPNAQALGLMSLHQFGAGQYESAQALADESVSRLAQLFADLDQEILLKSSVQATTLYGAIALAR